MNEINNLTYTLEINFTNKAGLKTSISIKLHDNGLEIKSVKIGDVCVTEETINGRVLSGRLDNTDGYCGYRYDYQNGEVLTNINPSTPLNTATNLINDIKNNSEFTSAKLVLSSLLRNDYRVVILSEGSLNIIKTISAEDENGKNYSYQEVIDLVKQKGTESFAEQHKEKVYKIEDACIVEETPNLTNSDIKYLLSQLIEIYNQNPKSYKDLIKFKTQIHKKYIKKKNEENCYE